MLAHLRSLYHVRSAHVPPADAQQLSAVPQKLPMRNDIICLRSLYHDSRFQRLTLLRNYHDPIRRSPIMQACWLTCAHYILNPKDTQDELPLPAFALFLFFSPDFAETLDFTLDYYII
jgi:hypothetical protein